MNKGTSWLGLGHDNGSTAQRDLWQGPMKNFRAAIVEMECAMSNVDGIDEISERKIITFLIRPINGIEITVYGTLIN